MNTWNYRVESQGRDFSIQMRHRGAMGPLTVRDEYYFNHIEDALVAVLTRQPEMIDLEGNGSGQYIQDKVTILDNRSGQQLGQLQAVTLNKSPDGDPVPGIYLAFDAGMEAACQQLKLDPDLISGYYGPNGILLARYSYNQQSGLVLAGNPSLLDLVDELGKSHPEPWQYCLASRDMVYATNASNQPHQTICRRYHYADYHAALTSLILTNPTDLDAFRRLHLLGKDSYTYSASLVTRQDEPLAHLSLTRSDSYPDDLHTGVHISFASPPEAIKNMENMPVLIPHPRRRWTYGLYRYDNDGESFTPVTNFFRLLSHSILPNNAVPKQDGIYSLEFGFQYIERTAAAGQSSQIISHSSESHYSSLDHAVEALFSIHTHLFNMLEQRDYGFFIPVATVKRTLDNRPVMSRSMTADNVKYGTELQLMRDQLTPEVLESIQKCFQRPSLRALPGGIRLPYSAADEKDHSRQREAGEQLHKRRRNGL